MHQSEIESRSSNVPALCYFIASGDEPSQFIVSIFHSYESQIYFVLLDSNSIILTWPNFFCLIMRVGIFAVIYIIQGMKINPRS